MEMNLTFDLQYRREIKAEAYRMWIRRVYNVSATLKMSYSELWDLPEQEFLVLENLAIEIQDKEKQQQKEIVEELQQRKGSK